MTNSELSMSVCGVDELPAFRDRRVSHVLSLLDPDFPEIEAFARFGDHYRKTIRFHDLIEPEDGKIIPELSDVEDVLAFGEDYAAFKQAKPQAHLLVHCRMGVSRSTAMMLTLLAQSMPEASADDLFAQLRAIRPRAWPNSRIIGFTDTLLGRGGELKAALGRHYALQIERDPQFVPMMRGYRRDEELRMGGVGEADLR